VRICIVYDCLYPNTIGGAERWYRNLAQRLAGEGHDVSYLTLRQWETGDEPRLDGVRVIPVGPRMKLYAGGRRRIGPPVVFGIGVLRHLTRHGSRYDVVHTASFPYFSLLAAGVVRPWHRFRLVVDWHEVWTREYWLEYLGQLGGSIGWWIQELCMRIPQRAFCFSHLHEQRLLAGGVRGDVVVLRGQYEGPTDLAVRPAEPVVVFAGRHIPEKRVDALIPAVARARAEIPELRAEIYGDGPDRAKVLELIRVEGLESVIEAPGFVEGSVVEQALARALCLVLPSRREGYGLVVLEAAARGTPAVLVRGPDNAATELVSEGESGFIASSASAEDVAAAIVRVSRAGDGLRQRTASWFKQNLEPLSLQRSLEVVAAAYTEGGHRSTHP
jgi:glycosyltransferase involved in cell wall biosynthesis